ncbi:hypothetical protein I316_02795 [Kwoniella heveanensis BCC8398]|uniref:Uncharacterized protein n=1 Tax=Kwoniella heveanensis BCC8398 TaxID=1296120 RepID=A0A1B9GW55_9TREE|nr:hypothetical protein I316_02795 [Kwoniella heveanensis BCC8398]
MGNSNSKKSPERNAVQFRVYSFWNAGDSYASCHHFANTPSELFDKVAVTQLNDDITFVACYRMKPYTQQDVRLLTAILKTAVGSSFALHLTSTSALPNSRSLQKTAIKIPLTPHTNTGRGETTSVPAIRRKTMSDGASEASSIERRGTEQNETETIPLNLKTSAGWAYTVDVTVGGIRVPLKVRTLLRV